MEVVNLLAGWWRFNQKGEIIDRWTLRGAVTSDFLLLVLVHVSCVISLFQFSLAGSADGRWGTRQTPFLADKRKELPWFEPHMGVRCRVSVGLVPLQITEKVPETGQRQQTSRCLLSIFA